MRRVSHLRLCMQVLTLALSYSHPYYPTSVHCVCHTSVGGNAELLRDEQDERVREAAEHVRFPQAGTQQG